MEKKQRGLFKINQQHGRGKVPNVERTGIRTGAVLSDLVGGQIGPKKSVDQTFWQKP
jgi:hypothetical protein